MSFDFNKYTKNNDRSVIIINEPKDDFSVMNDKKKKELLLTLAKKVKELRTNKGLTQEEAFNDTGVHFGRIEQGQRDISFTTLYKICNYFDLSMSEFLSKDFKK